MTAPEETRERIRQTLAETWWETVAVTHWHVRRVNDRIPRARHPKARTPLFLAVAAVGVAIIILPRILVSAVAMAFGLGGDTTTSRGLGRVIATGPADCAALPAVRALDGLRGHLWLVWSHSHLALVHSAPDAPVQVLWQADGARRPRLSTTTVSSLTWPDGSTLSCPLSAGEQQRVRERAGRP